MHAAQVCTYLGKYLSGFVGESWHFAVNKLKAGGAEFETVSAFTPAVRLLSVQRANRLDGLVVRCPPWERKIPGSNPACVGIFSGSSHTIDLNIGTPVATLPGGWRNKVSAGTGWPSVSILWLGEVESLICSFYLKCGST